MWRIGIAMACVLLWSCKAEDDDGSTGASASGSGGASSTGGTTAPTTVQCDANVCADGELCVWPSSQCDYSETAGVVMRADQACMLFPVVHGDHQVALVVPVEGACPL